MLMTCFKGVGPQHDDHILEFTITEARWHGDSEFSLRKEVFETFFGLCFLCGVLKVWDGLPTICGRHNKDDLSFQTRQHFNASTGDVDTVDEMLHACST